MTTIVTKQVLYLADNLRLMKDYVKNNKTGIVDLIYIDPPFNSKRNYNMVFSDSDATEQAFTDIWSNVSYLDELDEINNINPNLYSFLKNLESTGLQKSMLSYLTAMGIRLYYMRLLLKDTGSIYVQCDDAIGHYLKVVMDYIFGLSNFRNHITWQRSNDTGSSKAIAKFYPRNCDCIYFYTKTKDYIWNPQYQIGSEEIVDKKFKLDDNDGKGLYYWENLKTYSQERFDLLMLNNEIKQRDSGKYSYKRYKSSIKNEGIVVSNLWNDINRISNPDYPTQKPEPLLERIIKASSNEGDLVMDFYNGGGTTGAVCKRLNRNYLGVDINYRAIQISQKRLEDLGCILKKDLIIYGIPKSSSELRKMVNDNILGTNKNSRFDLEEVIVKYYLEGVVGNDVKVNDSSIDGTFGFDYDGRKCKGLVQVTSGSNKNHLKAFCSEIGKGTGDLGVYICFKDDVTDGFIQEVKRYGKIGNVDKIQILTLEDLIDNNILYKLP